MDAGHDYAFFTHRIESFKGRRVVVPTVKNPRAVKTFLWPHPDNWGPTPRTLAAAGFFFAPAPNSIDRVECFCCKRGLGSWERTDNPFKEHYERAEDECAWAAARCSLERDRKGKGKSISWRFATDDRVPTDQSRYEARLQTFRDWPFDRVRGSTCTSKALARAGFVHTPEADNEDMTTCFYCDRELGGWKASDDPLGDHRRGDQACPFLGTYNQTEFKKKKRSARTVLSKTASRTSLARHRVSSTHTPEVDLPVKRTGPKGSRSVQSEAERETTTDADMATDTAPPSKPRRGPGRPKKAASPRIRSPVEAAGIDSYPTRPKRSKRASAVSKTRTVADSESDALVKPKRGKARSKAKVANSDDEGVKPLASRRALRTPAAKGRRARSSDSSSDELLLPPSRRGTDLDSGSEGQLAGRAPSRASSRASSRAAASRMASKTPATSNAKKSNRARATSRAASSTASDDDDDGSGAESSKSGARGRARGSSRGRKTVTARDVAEQSASLRRSSRTPGRSTFNGRSAATESEADVDNLLKAAAARAAARYASESNAEGKKKGGIVGLPNRSPRARAASVLASDKDEASDTVAARPVPPFEVDQEVGIVPREAPANESQETGGVLATLSLRVDSHRAETTGDAYLAVSDSGTDDMNERTPQPPKTSISVTSASQRHPIPPPDFSRETLLAAPAPSERSAVNEWRELAIQSKTQGNAVTTAIPVEPKALRGGGTEMHGLPRIIAPLRKSKGYASHCAPQSPKVKIEEDDSVIMISPPRPSRSAARPAPSIDQTLFDKSNQGSGVAAKSRMALQNEQPSKLPTPGTRTPQRTTNHNDMTSGPERAVRSPTSQSRPDILAAPNAEQVLGTPHIASQALALTLASTVPSGMHEDISNPLVPATGSNNKALNALRHILPTVTPNHGLTEDQLNSTLEEFIRAETQRKYSEIQAEGERLLRELQEEGARSRTVIIDHLRFSSHL